MLQYHTNMKTLTLSLCCYVLRISVTPFNLLLLVQLAEVPLLLEELGMVVPTVESMLMGYVV